jgi:hypothetical protein
MGGDRKPPESGMANGTGSRVEVQAQEALLGLESEADRRELAARLLDALTGLRFGELTLVVQDGVVVQVVRTEKRRLVTKRSASR